MHACKHVVSVTADLRVQNLVLPLDIALDDPLEDRVEQSELSLQHARDGELSRKRSAARHVPFFLRGEVPPPTPSPLGGSAELIPPPNRSERLLFGAEATAT